MSCSGVEGEPLERVLVWELSASTAHRMREVKAAGDSSPQLIWVTGSVDPKLMRLSSEIKQAA